MRTNTGKITLASKFNSSDVRVYVPEKARLNGLDYVQTYRLQAAHPVGHYPFIVSLDDDITLTVSFDPITVDIRSPFTLPYIYKVVGQAASNYAPGHGEYAKQIASTDNTDAALLTTGQLPIYTEIADSINTWASASYTLAMQSGTQTGSIKFEVATAGQDGNTWSIESAESAADVIAIDTDAKTVTLKAGALSNAVYEAWRDETAWHPYITITESGITVLKVPIMASVNFSGGKGVSAPEATRITTQALVNAGAFTLESLTDYKTRKGL